MGIDVTTIENSIVEYSGKKRKLADTTTQYFLALVGLYSKELVPVEILGWRRTGSSVTFEFGPEIVLADNMTIVADICQSLSEKRFEGLRVNYVGFRKYSIGSRELPSFEVQTTKV